MRKIGNLPKMFGKYNISRYNSSFDAEYKKTSTSELMHSAGQFMDQNRYTTNVPYSVFVLSNQGLIGAPESGVSFEEDFRAVQSSFESYAIRGGYCVLRSGTKPYNISGSNVYHRFMCTYMGDGTTWLAAASAPANAQTTVFTPEQITIGGYTQWHGERLPQSSSRLMDQSAFVSSTSNTAESYYKGKTIGRNLRTGGGSSQGGGYNCMVTSTGGNGYGNVATMTSTEAASWYVRNDITGALAQPRPYSSPEILCHVTSSGYPYSSGAPYDSTTRKIMSAESGKPISGIGNFSNVGDQNLGRYFQTGTYNSSIGAWNYFYLNYYDPETESVSTADVTDYAIHGGYMNVLSSTIRGSKYNSPVGETNFIYAHKFDVGNAQEWKLFFKAAIIETGTDLKGHITFGSCYLDIDTRILKDVETGEQIDFSNVLPEPVTDDVDSYVQRAGGYSSGLYGTMAVYYPTYQYGEGHYHYVFSKHAVFRLPRLHYSENNSQRFIMWPVKRHMHKVYLFYEQVMYVISEKEFRAYDMQTFIRLDHLPNFESAVEKIWERPS